ncbi:MAG: AIPR family protein [Thermodesulfobacteriota bacterium]|nr:AIPR family protein [Thermodesulfobacteriota bacterium]
MTSNDRIILDQVLEQKRQAVAPTSLRSFYFEIFTAEQILKDYDLSYDEIESGNIGGGGDGGIDSFYLFVNGELIQEDSDFSEMKLKKNITIELYIIQSKISHGFSEAAIDKYISATDELFDLSQTITDLKTVYNKSLLETIERFRSIYQNLASKFPQLHMHYFYATLGDEVHPNVQRKVDKLKDVIKKHFSAAAFTFEFLGASELLMLARRTPSNSYVLNLSENPISATGAVAFVCLVSLKDFFKFITDSQGHLIRYIFEANVRDYQGKTEVNDQIQTSLQDQSSEDFWWLNNGITILSSRATQSGKALTIENPEIVNGLQTSTEIYNYFKKYNTENEKRNLQIRVIVPNEPESRDRIIKATNSQTIIPPASLRATDKIHRDIEEYLKPFGLYYDRRKNYYKNEGKQINRIISIPQMAQAVMAISLKRPDMARARPSSLIKRDEEYINLFDSRQPIEIYRACAELMKQVEAFLNNLGVSLSVTDKNNIKFYIMMCASQEALQDSDPMASPIASLAGVTLSEEVMESSYNLVLKEYTGLGGTDKVAKGSELLSKLKERMQEKFLPKTQK